MEVPIEEGRESASDSRKGRNPTAGNVGTRQQEKSESETGTVLKSDSTHTGNFMNSLRKKVLYTSGLIATGLILGWLLFSGPSGGGESNHVEHNHLDREELDRHIQDAHTDDEGEIIYTCSMHPQIRENEPGNCPICGMELIPVSSQESGVVEDDYSMVMTASAVKLADIRTTPVVRDIPQRELDLPGRIRVDERNLTRVTAHFPGRIRDLRVDFTGAPIRQGEVMATIYSPELITAQRELLEAERQRDRNPRLYEAARQKFRLWEFTDAQIREIEEMGEVRNELEILSPADGYVMSRNIAREQHVEEGSVLFEVASLDPVRVVPEAYEEDIEWVTAGDTLGFHTRSNPARSYVATVYYIYPFVDSQTRTVSVRADLANSESLLKPDMLVRARLESHMEREKLLVPSSAVLWTGPRSLLYVRDTTSDVPRFEVREVELGSRSGAFYIIEAGVNEGEEVVVNGAFRIDSEMQLADRFSMMNRQPGSGAVPVHDHGVMNGDDRQSGFQGTTGAGHTDHPVEDASRSEALDGVTEEFQEDFMVFLDSYLQAKEALIASDREGARRSFHQMNGQLEGIGERRMQADAHVQWMEYHDAIGKILAEIRIEDNLAGMRADFVALSGLLIDAVYDYGIPGVIYHQYCPMEDASWLSRDDQIENPYSPETMPTCGELIERIDL